MNLLITLTRDEDGIVIAECPAIPGCISQGATEDEAEKTSERLSKCALKFALSKVCLLPLRHDK